MLSDTYPIKTKQNKITCICASNIPECLFIKSIFIITRNLRKIKICPLKIIEKLVLLQWKIGYNGENELTTPTWNNIGNLEMCTGTQ